eukprot:scaffold7101_cov153-Amphora_coffeaeformis.AAC.3
MPTISKDIFSSTRRRKTSNAASSPLELPDGLPSSSSFPGDTEQRRERRKRKRRKQRDGGREESFICLFLRTGSVIAFLWLGSWSIYRHFVPYQEPLLNSILDDDFVGNSNNQIIPPEVAEVVVPEVNATIPPLPKFDVSQRARLWDAHAIAQRHATPSTTSSLFWQEAAWIRQNFTELYGEDETTVRALLDRGLTRYDSINGKDGSSSLPPDLRHTACRLIRAKNDNRPFLFSFAGYSVTVGRGNYFHQSYPLVMERILHNVFGRAGISLQVRNAAIGGCPAFPYGWCLPNFLGAAPDVISWDFAMNEAGGDPMGLEAYLRRVWHDLGSNSRAPQIIVRDTHLATERRVLLQNYSRWFPDALTMHTDPAVEPYLKLPEPYRPKGFQEWRKFGAPNGAPGQAVHHPAVAEHKFMAYLLSMHYLSALELVMLQDELDTTDSLYLSCAEESLSQENSLPAPWTWTEASTKDAPWLSLFFGDASNGWKMTDIACRTSFEPIVAGDLTPLVLAGSEGEDLDILKPRSKMFYNKGWTLDLAHDEKQAKKNLLRYGGLGFIDSKKAYYGIEMSGWLRMILPFENTSKEKPESKDAANKLFRSVVVCEVNDKTTTGHKSDQGPRCKFDEDVDFRIGGINATASIKPVTAGGSLYLGKKVCYHFSVPDGARLTTASELFEKAANETRARIVAENSNHIESRQQALDPMVRLPIRDDVYPTVGMSVEVRVQNPHIFHVEQACSIAHVIWEYT